MASFINLNSDSNNISYFGNDFIYVNKTIKKRNIRYSESIMSTVYAIEEDKEILPPNKKIIHIVIYFGEDYVAYPLVSMTSAMIHCNINKTILIYHFFSEAKNIS